MHFEFSEEQRLIVGTARNFAERELYPHEDEIERCRCLYPELASELSAKAIDAGLYAANTTSGSGGTPFRAPYWVRFAASWRQSGESHSNRAGVKCP
jgi:acyl-CoA dehydrogenase